MDKLIRFLIKVFSKNPYIFEYFKNVGVLQKVYASEDIYIHSEIPLTSSQLHEYFKKYRDDVIKIFEKCGESHLLNSYTGFSTKRCKAKKNILTVAYSYYKIMW